MASNHAFLFCEKTNPEALAALRGFIFPLLYLRGHQLNEF
nr:MAG TPA: hypothetical protein [Bacteriophage sp.]